MCSSQHGAISISAMARSNHAPASSRSHQARHEWLTLTDLGRLYGVSAVHCGRLLSEAGLRHANGNPTREAFRNGLAHRGHPGGSALWDRKACGQVLERAGLIQTSRRTLIDQWADLLSTLFAGAPGVDASAEDMARELPDDLVPPVNAELVQRGCSFQVQRQASRRASACRDAVSSSSRSRSSSV